MTFSNLVIVLLAFTALVLLFQVRTLRDRLFALTLETHGYRRETAQSKELIAQAEQRLNGVLDASFNAIFLLDQDRIVVSMNRAARDLLHLPDRTVGQTLMTVMRNHELDSYAAMVLQDAQHPAPLSEFDDEFDDPGETIGIEQQITVRDRSYLVRATPIRVDSGSMLVLAMQDVSELLRLSRARRDMVANFSHDLRHPVANIRLLVESLSKHIGENLDADRSALNKIASETDSLQHLTQELIDLNMIESGRANIRMIPVNFVDVIRDAMSTMETQANQKQITLSNEIPADLRVLADPDLVKRVITNLIHNSIKFTSPGGEVRIEAQADPNPPRIPMTTIRVKDTGVGIPPWERQRIFERFYQVDTARTNETSAETTNNSGSGLGLSIAKHIIEAHGGTIWAESGVPTGAWICFTLPLVHNF
jgi:two-component system, OmpR family, phosphate regulon sensor histidine kinase PhoR